jgi:hypothetical protein
LKNSSEEQAQAIDIKKANEWSSKTSRFNYKTVQRPNSILSHKNNLRPSMRKFNEEIQRENSITKVHHHDSLTRSWAQARDSRQQKKDVQKP